MNTKTLKKIRFADLIIFEDEYLIAVDKPLMLSSLEDKAGPSLIDYARDYWPDIQLCHRLDKSTSGVLLMAKDPETYRTMSLQFQNRTVKKEYLALVEGVHKFDHHEINLPLHVTTNKKVSVNKREGKPANTIITTIETFRSYSVLRCEPVTGRMHQIRVHLSATGIPIVGDILYGGRNLLLSELKRHYKLSTTQEEEQPVNHGFMLHAQRTTFQHPQTGETMTVETPLPKNFQVTLKVLEKFNR